MQNKAVNAVVCIILALFLFICVNAGVNLVSSYNPKGEEEISLVGYEKNKKLSSDKIKILTFNTGYGALGQEASLSKEGGKDKRQSADTVLKNLRGISEIVNLSNADIVLLQDVDIDSYRSRYVDQQSYYIENGSFLGAFASTVKVKSESILPPYKKLSSGLLTLNRSKVHSAKRVPLSSFGGPLANKKAMLVCEYEIEKSNKKLVVINFSPDAYTLRENREKQLSEVVAFAEKEAEKGNYVVVGGSFYSHLDESKNRYPLNDRNPWQPGTFGYENLKNGFSLCYDSAVPSARILSKAYDNTLSLESQQVYVSDGFIVSKNVNVKMVVTVDQQFRYSYHNPVYLEIEIAK